MCRWSEALPSWAPQYRKVSAFLVLLMCVVGIVGNAVAALVVLTTRDMHTATNCYLVSLALADLNVLVAVGLPNISDSLAGQWIYRHVLEVSGHQRLLLLRPGIHCGE